MSLSKALCPHCLVLVTIEEIENTRWVSFDIKLTR